MNSSRNFPEQPIVASAGIRVLLTAPRDPYAELDELMSVIEALCPVWPDRDVFVSAGKMLL